MLGARPATTTPTNNGSFYNQPISSSASFSSSLQTPSDFSSENALAIKANIHTLLERSKQKARESIQQQQQLQANSVTSMENGGALGVFLNEAAASHQSSTQSVKISAQSTPSTPVSPTKKPASDNDDDWGAVFVSSREITSPRNDATLPLKRLLDSIRPEEVSVLPVNMTNKKQATTTQPAPVQSPDATRQSTANPDQSRVVGTAVVGPSRLLARRHEQATTANPPSTSVVASPSVSIANTNASLPGPTPTPKATPIPSPGPLPVAPVLGPTTAFKTGNTPDLAPKILLMAFKTASVDRVDSPASRAQSPTASQLPAAPPIMLLSNKVLVGTAMSPASCQSAPSPTSAAKTAVVPPKNQAPSNGDTFSPGRTRVKPATTTTSPSAHGAASLMSSPAPRLVTTAVNQVAGESVTEPSLEKRVEKLVGKSAITPMEKTGQSPADKPIEKKAANDEPTEKFVEESVEGATSQPAKIATPDAAKPSEKQDSGPSASRAINGPTTLSISKKLLKTQELRNFPNTNSNKTTTLTSEGIPATEEPPPTSFDSRAEAKSNVSQGAMSARRGRCSVHPCQPIRKTPEPNPVSPIVSASRTGNKRPRSDDMRDWAAVEERSRRRKMRDVLQDSSRAQPAQNTRLPLPTQVAAIVAMDADEDNASAMEIDTSRVPNSVTEPRYEMRVQTDKQPPTNKQLQISKSVMEVEAIEQVPMESEGQVNKQATTEKSVEAEKQTHTSKTVKSTKNIQTEGKPSLDKVAQMTQASTSGNMTDFRNSTRPDNTLIITYGSTSNGNKSEKRFTVSSSKAGLSKASTPKVSVSEVCIPTVGTFQAAVSDASIPTADVPTTPKVSTRTSDDVESRASKSGGVPTTGQLESRSESSATNMKGLNASTANARELNMNHYELRASRSRTSKTPEAVMTRASKAKAQPSTNTALHDSSSKANTPTRDATRETTRQTKADSAITRGMKSRRRRLRKERTRRMHGGVMVDEDEDGKDPDASTDEFMFVRAAHISSSASVAHSGRLTEPSHPPITEAEFDTYIYRQAGAQMGPPRGVKLPETAPAITQPPFPFDFRNPAAFTDGQLYLHMDPRVHYNSAKPAGWGDAMVAKVRARKQREEEDAAGAAAAAEEGETTTKTATTTTKGKGRDGKRRKHRGKDATADTDRDVEMANEMDNDEPTATAKRSGPSPWMFTRPMDFGDVPEDELPDYVRANPQWLRACAWMRECRKKRLARLDEVASRRSRGEDVGELVREREKQRTYKPKEDGVWRAVRL